MLACYSLLEEVTVALFWNGVTSTSRNIQISRFCWTGAKSPVETTKKCMEMTLSSTDVRSSFTRSQTNVFIVLVSLQQASWNLLNDIFIFFCWSFLSTEMIAKWWQTEKYHSVIQSIQAVRSDLQRTSTVHHFHGILVVSGFQLNVLDRLTPSCSRLSSWLVTL